MSPADFFTFFGRGTGPKRSGAVLACFWSNFQAECSILDPIRAIFDDLDPPRHFGWDLDLQASSWRYPKPCVSTSLDWLAWVGLARLASAWLVSSAAVTTTAATPEQACKATAAALHAAAVVDAYSAAEETSHAEARLAKPSQASQSREGLTNGIGYF